MKIKISLIRKIILVIFLLAQARLFSMIDVIYAATEHATSEIPYKKLVFAIINFVLFIVLLYFLLRKHIKNFFENRAFSIRKEIEIEKQASAKLDEKFSVYNYRLKNIDNEIKILKNKIKEQANEEKETIIINAQNLAKRIKEETEKICKAEFERAKYEIKESIAFKAQELAQELIKLKITKEDHDRLFDEFMTNMQKYKQ